uniref:Uncharacterized protein n=1 Tax=Oryza barthii TaxID=65489 RepID=A0A0D3FNI0_9ORYZ
MLEVHSVLSQLSSTTLSSELSPEAPSGGGRRRQRRAAPGALPSSVHNGGAGQIERRRWVARSSLGSPDLAADGDGGLVSLPLRWGARRLVGKEATTAAGRRALPLAPQCGLPTSRVLFFRPRTGGKHWTQLYFGGPGSKRGPTWEGEAERHTSPL